MSRFFIVSLLFASLPTVFTSCQNELPDANMPAMSAKEHSTEQGEFNKTLCSDDSSCFQMDVRYTLLKGPDPAVEAKVNKSLMSLFYQLSGADTTRPLLASLDSLMAARLKDISNMSAMMPGSKGVSMKVVLHSKDLMLTDRFYSHEVHYEIPLGFKQTLSATGLLMFDLETGMPLKIEDLITDTDALMPLVEEAYLKDKQAFAPGGQLSEIIFDKKEHLPLPQNLCIVPEGLRVGYRNLEVAPINVGGFDTVLPWQQVAGIVDWKKWLEPVPR